MNKTGLLVALIAIAVLGTFVALSPGPSAPPPFDHVIHCDFASKLSVTCWKSEERGRWTYGSEPGTFKYLTWTRYTECFNPLYQRSYQEISENKPHALSSCYPSPFIGDSDTGKNEKDESEEKELPGGGLPPVVDPDPVPEPTSEPGIDPDPTPKSGPTPKPEPTLKPEPVPTKVPDYPVNPNEPPAYQGVFTWTHPYSHHTDPHRGQAHPVWGKTRCVEYKGGYVNRVYVGKVKNGRAAGC